MLFWQMPEFEVLTASPPDTSDFLSITRPRKDRDEFAGGARGISNANRRPDLR